MYRVYMVVRIGQIFSSFKILLLHPPIRARVGVPHPPIRVRVGVPVIAPLIVPSCHG